MLQFKEINSYLEGKGAEATMPFQNDLVAYSIDDNRVAYIGKNSKPLRISLRAEQVLASHLIESYESVMLGHKLDPKKWITVLDTGQLTEQEILDLLDHSIQQAGSSK